MTINLERRFDRVDAKLDRLDRKLDELRDSAKIDLAFQKLDRNMTTYFRWIIGLKLVEWLTLMYKFSHALH